MRGKSPDNLSAEELEELIWQRRTGVKQPTFLSKPVPITPKQIPTDQRRRKGWEKGLLLVEILAVVALLLITGISTRGWMALRQRLPLAGVTLIDETVLAASPAEIAELSSLPPIGWRNSPMAGLTTAAETQPQNQPLETPAHLKRWLQPGSVAPVVSVPKPVVQPATRIIIPSIGINAPVGEGTDWEALKYKVGHQPSTANPGERGNMVLAAHNDIYGEIFRYLPDVPVGEIITIYAGEEAFRYQITERRIITPDQVEVMLPTTGPTTTLISCYPYLIDTHRIVLFGELVE